MHPDPAADIEVRIPREGLGHLTCEPGLRRVLGDLEMNNPSSVVAENDHGVEQPKRRGRNNEHVDRHRLAHVVPQEAAPGRGVDFGSPRHVSPDGGLADHDTEFERAPWKGAISQLETNPPGNFRSSR